MTDTHSPLPWSIYKDTVILCAEKSVVATVQRATHQTTTSPANARLIVQAVNERQELIEALEALVSQVNTTINIGAQTGSHWSRLTVANLKAKSALSKAQGNQTTQTVEE